MQAFESLGMWYLPGESERAVAGTLRFSPGDGLLLLLTGTLRELFGSSRLGTYEIIHGLVRDSPYGRFITLVDCFQRSATFAIPGFASEEIRANRAYVGHRHLSTETFTVGLARAGFSGLSEWTGLTGFQPSGFHYTGDGEVDVRYRKPEPVELRLDGGSAQIRAGVVTSRSGNTLSMTEHVYVALDLAEPHTPHQILRRYVSPLQDFLTFVSDRPAPLEDLSFTETMAETPEPIYLCFQAVYREAELKAMPSPYDMLFTWPGIRASHPDILTRWYALRRRYDAACDIYFSLYYAAPTYVEARYLLAWHALALFLITRRDVAANSIESDALKISAELPLAWRESLFISEEFMAPSSTQKLIEDYSDLLLPVIGQNAEAIVTELLQTRHHLFHRDPGVDPAKRSLRVLQLFEIIRLFIKVVMLEELSLSKIEITDILSSARQYAWLLSLRRDDAAGAD